MINLYSWFMWIMEIVTLRRKIVLLFLLFILNHDVFLQSGALAYKSNADAKKYEDDLDVTFLFICFHNHLIKN